MGRLNQDRHASLVQRREVGAEDHVTNDVTAERGRKGIIDVHSPEDWMTTRSLRCLQRSSADTTWISDYKLSTLAVCFTVLGMNI